MTVCCCSNPSCIVNGCQALRIMQHDFGTKQESPVIPSLPLRKSEPLTEEDVRRIMREELVKLLEDLKK